MASLTERFGRVFSGKNVESTMGEPNTKSDDDLVLEDSEEEQTKVQTMTILKEELTESNNHDISVGNPAASKISANGLPFNSVADFIGSNEFIKCMEASPYKLLTDTQKVLLATPIGIEDPLKINVFKLDRLTKEPISPDKNVGVRFSSIIDTLASKFNIRIVPEDVLNIPEWANPSNHVQFMVGNKRYFAPVNSSSYVEELARNFAEKMNNGEIIKWPVAEEFMYEGRSVITFKISPSELQDLMSFLDKYSAKLVDIDTSVKGLYLVAGDYVG